MKLINSTASWRILSTVRGAYSSVPILVSPHPVWYYGKCSSKTNKIDTHTLQVSAGIVGAYQSVWKALAKVPVLHSSDDSARLRGIVDEEVIGNRRHVELFALVKEDRSSGFEMGCVDLIALKEGSIVVRSVIDLLREVLRWRVVNRLGGFRPRIASESGEKPCGRTSEMHFLSSWRRKKSPESCLVISVITVFFCCCTGT